MKEQLLKEMEGRIAELQRDDMIHPSSKAKLIKENKRWIERIHAIEFSNKFNVNVPLRKDQ